MRSSNVLSQIGRSFASMIGLLSAACSTSLPANKAEQPARLVCAMTPEVAASQQQGDVIAVFRRTVESGPLFSVLADHASVSSCRIAVDSGLVSVEYKFRDGGWLRAKRESGIEYSEQELRFGTPPAENPIAVLTAAERAAFSTTGCGIDWKTVETRPADDDRNIVEKIYRGDTCNCQARIRSDTAGRVIGLLFRSAC
jgi:hypothetical protein